MTIYAMFMENNKCLMKDDYVKPFDVKFDEQGLLEMLSAIKVPDDVVVFIDNKKLYFKVKFSIDFKKYKISQIPFFDENSRNKDFYWLNKEDYIECGVKNEWQQYLGKEIIICNDRKKQVEVVEELDKCCFMVVDIEELKNNLLNGKNIGDKLCTKMFLTDEQIAEMGKEDVI